MIPRPPALFTMDKWHYMSALVAHQQPLISDARQNREFKKICAKRFFAINFIVFALQYAGLAISTLMVSGFPLWFASGTACGLIFMWGPRVLPGIWLGSLLAYFLLKVALTQVFICASVFALQAATLLWLSYRYITPLLMFHRKSVFFKFILLSGVLTALAALVLVSVSSSNFGNNSPQHIQLWLQWWLANLDGLLVFSFAFIALDSYFSQLFLLRKMYLPALSIHYGILVMLGFVLCFSTHLILTATLALAVLVTHLVISLRYGWCGMIAAVFLTGLLLCFGALLQAPLFNPDLGLAALIYIKVLLLVALVLGGWVTIKH